MTAPDQPAQLVRRQELGSFLRAQREHLAPGDVGLPATPRRRTPGLRREEVAALSGVGVAWYTWLEQGRVDTSRQVLDAVGRALRLADAEHRHVLTLAGFAPPPAEETGDSTGLRRLIRAWPDSPALVLDPALGITAWNAAYTTLWPDPGDVPPENRNLLLLLVGDPAHQGVLPDWEPVAQDLHRHFRGHADTVPQDGAVRALNERLHALRPDLADWWACRTVGGFTSRSVRLVSASGTRRPYEMTLLGAPGGHILVQTPESHDGNAAGADRSSYSGSTPSMPGT